MVQPKVVDIEVDDLKELMVVDDMEVDNLEALKVVDDPLVNTTEVYNLEMVGCLDGVLEALVEVGLVVRLRPLGLGVGHDGGSPLGVWREHGPRQSLLGAKRPLQITLSARPTVEGAVCSVDRL